MPSSLDVTCPRCGGHARYEHAEIALINRKKNIDFFRHSRDFSTARVETHGGKANAAILWHGLHRKDPLTVPPLPREERLDDWIRNRNIGPKLDAGVIACPACGLRRKHLLDWPHDALFQIEHRGKLLWAFTRDHALELLDYVRSESRSRGQYRHKVFLMKVPTHFLTAKARDDVSKKLEALLKSQ
ncbi:hypothetical protein FF098_003945 [Parvularcula flava]|uniref:Uncharacterized protein n=1 Tax=Aquisalinus luteolus TaxID=1566827 RepID=A0A8J3A208_9PROT|nr:hypothetical protein [Aquisalinus luteolus]NHK27055.1 hypothetical protein [Aquisalinus luteolus]GGH94229.1 hypothetical protein GCM10011355_07920 [Aquisalinus luteolus]